MADGGGILDAVIQDYLGYPTVGGRIESAVKRIWAEYQFHSFDEYVGAVER